MSLVFRSARKEFTLRIAPSLLTRVARSLDGSRQYSSASRDIDLIKWVSSGQYPSHPPYQSASSSGRPRVTPRDDAAGGQRINLALSRSPSPLKAMPQSPETKLASPRNCRQNSSHQCRQQGSLGTPFEVLTPWFHVVHTRHMSIGPSETLASQPSSTSEGAASPPARPQLPPIASEEQKESGAVKESPMVQHLKSLIKFRGGPISVAEYMSQVLTSEQAGGFYMTRDVFGAGGDFITSPDISQMFGELLGVWCMLAWEQLGRPPAVRLVELGPGRGTLMADLLRSTAKFSDFSSSLDVHLVEVSPALRQLQWQALNCTPCPSPPAHSASTPSSSSSPSSPPQQTTLPPPTAVLEDTSVLLAARTSAEPLSDASTTTGSSDSRMELGGTGERGGDPNGEQQQQQQEHHRSHAAGSSKEEKDALREGVSGFKGASVTWHSTFDEVPSGVPIILLAHEFYDALPVHQFQLTERGWCEKLVDVQEEEEGGEATFKEGDVQEEEGDREFSQRNSKRAAEKQPSLPFRFVLSPGPTAPVTLCLSPRLKWADPPERSAAKHVEVCPAATKISLDIASRVATDGGAALIIDYGPQDGLVSDSLAAIKRHRFVHVFESPGEADLSAHVDFAAVRAAIKEAKVDVGVHGPISQSKLLGGLGINLRAEALLQNASEEQAVALRSAYWRLVGDGEPPWEDEEEEEASSSRNSNVHANGPQKLEGMGLKYKALAITSAQIGCPVAFE